MPFAYQPAARTDALFDHRWRKDGKEETSYQTRLAQHSSLEKKRVFETTPFTYGHGTLAIVRGIVTAVLFLAACITTAVAGGMVLTNASDHDNENIVKRWAGLLAIGNPILLFIALIFYMCVPGALQYGVVNRLIIGSFLLVYASNILLLQWAEGHASNSLHTRYKDADGPLEAAFVLNSFVAGVGICNIVGGLYSDLMWRQTPQEANARAKAAAADAAQA